MNNILCIFIFFSLTFNLNAASFDHQTSINFHRIILLNMTLINRLSEPAFVSNNLGQQKKYYKKRTKKIMDKQKIVKTKKYCLMQPLIKNSVKIIKNKEKILANISPIKQKTKPIKNKKNKISRQHFYDKKTDWLRDLDYDNRTIVFNEEEVIDVENNDEKIDALIKQWFLEDQLYEEEVYEEEESRIGLFCFINELYDEQNFLIEKYISEKELRKEHESAFEKQYMLEKQLYAKEKKAWNKACRQIKENSQRRK
jgi:hypothetical protein